MRASISMRTLEYTVPPEETGRKLEYVLRAHLGLSEHRLRSLKFANGILLDGVPAHTGRTVAAGQIVSVLLRDTGAGITPCALPLQVAYHDEDVLIVDKPAPLPSIASARQDTHTLENAVFAWLGCPEDFVYRPVSRLDKGTSGLMPIALNTVAHDRMQRMLHTGQYVREYLAVTDGVPQQMRGVIDLPIGRAQGVKRCIDEQHGKRAVTHYQVLQCAPNGRALLRLRLETGRTHQIRVHLQALGCPVAGDYLYGQALPQLAGRFALHATAMQLTHPMTGEQLAFESPLPPALRELLT